MRIDCEKVAQDIKDQIKNKVQAGCSRTLVIIKVGDDLASEAYVRGKIEDCREVGIDPVLFRFNESVTTDMVISLINQFQPKCHGIIVQLPLPEHIDKNAIINAIEPEKDVDGFRRDSHFIPCTPAGIMQVLPKDLSGKDVLIINRSDIVGRPLVNLLLDRNATVQIAHSKTKDLEAKIKQSDIIVTAVGKSNFIKQEWLNETQTVIDVAINRGEDGKLCGDLEKVYGEVDFAYTPVPKGIGLLTRAMLLKNVMGGVNS